MALVGAVLLNLAMLAVLAVYGRVRIFVPNKPADSMSVVFVDLPANPPVVDLRDPEIAPPEPEPEPVEEPEIALEPEPVPEPEIEPEPEPEPEPAPEPEPEPEPAIDLTPEEAFAPPSQIEDAPFIPDQPEPSPPPDIEETTPGDIIVEGEQAPAEEDAPPLIEAEPEARRAQAEEDARENDEDEPQSAVRGEIEAGADESDVLDEQPGAPASEPATPQPAGDDMFDEDPVFGAGRFALPAVELPKGDVSVAPGASGVVAIFCPDEFTDKEKIAECAGRPEIRSGWRPGSSGEDFSKAAAILKDRRRHGDFSDDAVTFGPEIARRAEQQRRIEDLEDFRRDQNLGGANIADDPASGTRPQLLEPIAQPSWTRRDDPLVDNKDVEKLRRDLEEAEKANSPPDE